MARKMWKSSLRMTVAASDNALSNLRLGSRHAFDAANVDFLGSSDVIEIKGCGVAVIATVHAPATRNLKLLNPSPKPTHSVSAHSSKNFRVGHSPFLFGSLNSLPVFLGPPFLVIALCFFLFRSHCGPKLSTSCRSITGMSVEKPFHVFPLFLSGSHCGIVAEKWWRKK